jgi:hypothetical protein
VSAEVGGDERAAFAVEEDEIIWAALFWPEFSIASITKIGGNIGFRLPPLSS